MMKKSALAGEGGGCTPIPFQPFPITYTKLQYALLLTREYADILPLFHLCPIWYSVGVNRDILLEPLTAHLTTQWEEATISGPSVAAAKRLTAHPNMSFRSKVICSDNSQFTSPFNYVLYSMAMYT